MPVNILVIAMFALISYLMGSLPFGLWVGLLWKGVDIRTLGSKNIGATNVLRVLGPGPGLLVFLLDTVKGSAGIVLARQLAPETPFGLLVLLGLCAILGHTFSPFLRFKGGKGVATSFGALLALAWPVAVIGVIGWTLTVLLTRYVSLASLAAAYSLPVSGAFVLHGDIRTWMFWLGMTLAILVTIKHRANIQRLMAGTEAKIGQRVSLPAENDTAQEIIEVK